MSVILDKNHQNEVVIIRNKLRKNIGNKVTINYNLGRNKFEKYDVIIKQTYKYIFIVELNINDNVEIKSFSYADIISKTIKIEY
ncbi:MAG: Veg family protein [Prolixibacteraceae bacterium]|nr:Veg family protein [Prolixibacteraceae bacterium]